MSNIYQDSTTGESLYNYNGQVYNAKTGAPVVGATQPPAAAAPVAPTTTSSNPVDTKNPAPANANPAPTTSGQGLADNSFLSVLNNMNTGFQQNNAIADQRNAVLGALFGTPVAPDKLSQLPPDIQNIINRGDRSQLMLQGQILTDTLNNKNASIASSIGYLTSGWQTAQTRYNTEATNVLNYAKALNVKPSDIVKAMFPDLLANMGSDQIKALDALSPPLLTNTQIPNMSGTGGLSVNIPQGTIAAQTNNPLNIKYSATSTAGGLDSGIAAQDGGTFASFSTPQDGLSAAVKLLKSSGYSGLTIDAAMRRWSNNGYGAEVSPGSNANQKMSSLSDSQLNQLVTDMATRESGATVTSSYKDQAQAYVEGIRNGTITSIAQVPHAYNGVVASMMLSQGVTSPLADRRFTMASNAEIANYIAMPEYTLTQNALPYLLKIDAAMTIPGSVSDQELLDSFTKLSTAGGVITDAQVRVITDGRSAADSISVYSKKLSEGGVLSDDQRQQIYKLGQASYKNLKIGYQPIYDKAVSKLKESQIPEPFWTLPDLNALSALSEKAVNAGGVSDTTGGPPGTSSAIDHTAILDSIMQGQ